METIKLMCIASVLVLLVSRYFVSCDHNNKITHSKNKNHNSDKNNNNTKKIQRLIHHHHHHHNNNKTEEF